MEHEDFEQLELPEFRKFGVPFVWWTFCKCGKAFGGMTSASAYAKWEQHESDGGY